MKKLITVLLISLGLNFTLFSQENIDLIILAGQSNALGRQGDAESYPTDTNNLDDQIRFNWTVANGSNSGGWTTMQPQVGFFLDGHFGPEVTFSRKLVQEGYNPAIFKFSQGATSLFQHWLNPGNGGLYDNMVTALNTAITELENQGHTVTVRGLIWIQGESDSNSQAAASAYFNNLTLLINDLRNNVVSNSDLPIILGVDEQFFNLLYHRQPEILNAHQDIALNDANIKFTSMYGYPKADVTHLTPEGLASHGEAIFDSYQLLINEQYPTENGTLSSSGNQISFERASWGQSFNTDNSGMLSTVTFRAASMLNSSATFTLYNSADCSGTPLYTQALDNIVVGDNTISVNSSLRIDKEHTYYMEIVADNDDFWRINYSASDNVFGLLRTFLNGSYCGRPFPSFDMNFSVVLTGEGSCADIANTYRFNYNNKTYDIVKENKTWVDAAACAVEQGGYLVEINDQSEQDIIFSELQNASIDVSNTVAPDGGNASYVLIGANDLNAEGQWFWNGNNDGNGIQFWQGGSTANGGVPVGGLYSNWGNEPDNWNSQDVAGIALTQWPVNSGSLGVAGQWNDIDESNTLYYIIEYPTLLGVSDNNIDEIIIFPNPVIDFLTIENNRYPINDIKIVNIQGQIINSIKPEKSSEIIKIDFSAIKSGVYFLNITYENGLSTMKKIIK